MRRIIGGLVLIILWTFPCLGEEIKVGCADFLEVFRSYLGTQEADAYLKKKADKLQSEIDVLKKELEEKEKFLKSGLLSEEEKAKKEKEVEEIRQRVEKKIKESNLEMIRERKEKIDSLVKEINSLIQEFGKVKGFDLIIDKRDVLFVQEGMDITQELINFINERKKQATKE